MAEQMVNWQDIIFDSAWLANLDRLTTRRFGEGGLAEEASTYVLECLSKNDWQALSHFKGQAKPKTFLHTITLNFIEEFSRKRFGRPRPPEWLKRQGDFWIQVWKFICLERQITQTVIDRLSDVRDSLYVKDVIRTIKARLPWCGSSAKEVSTATLQQQEDENNLEEILPDNDTPEKALFEAQYADLLLMLNLIFAEGGGDSENTFDAVASNLQTVSEKFTLFNQRLELSDEERLILKMTYQEGLKRSVVAKTLGMQAHLPGRILKRIFHKIHDTMDQCDLNIEDFKFESV